MTTQSSSSDHDKQFPIVGRDNRIDLTKYIVKVHGRDVIDYEKLRVDDAELYKDIVAGELKADRKEQEELDEILALPAIELTPELLKSLRSVVAPEKPATSKYFYLPLFLSIPSQAQSDKGHKADILTFSDDSGEPMSYASRVLPGQTLAEAVQDDLRTDFAYDGVFQIKNYHLHDTVSDKKGNQLPRLAVIIKVDHFPTNTLHPAGMRAQWSPTRQSAFEHTISSFKGLVS